MARFRFYPIEEARVAPGKFTHICEKRSLLTIAGHNFDFKVRFGDLERNSTKMGRTYNPIEGCTESLSGEFLSVTRPIHPGRTPWPVRILSRNKLGRNSQIRGVDLRWTCHAEGEPARSAGQDRQILSKLLKPLIAKGKFQSLDVSKLLPLARPVFSSARPAFGRGGSEALRCLHGLTSGNAS